MESWIFALFSYLVSRCNIVEGDIRQLLMVIGCDIRIPFTGIRRDMRIYDMVWDVEEYGEK